MNPVNPIHPIAVASVFAVWWFWRKRQLDAPSARWPEMKTSLGFTYEENPPRLDGAWNGRKIAIVSRGGAVVVTAELNAETSVRVECAPKAVVAKRAGAAADAIEPVSTAFRDKLAARCSSKAAGAVIFDAAMQQRLAELAAVDIVGERSSVTATVPALREIAETEALLGAMCAVADGLESFPKGGGMPSAQAKRP